MVALSYIEGRRCSLQVDSITRAYQKGAKESILGWSRPDSNRDLHFTKVLLYQLS